LKPADRLFLPGDLGVQRRLLSPPGRGFGGRITGSPFTIADFRVRHPDPAVQHVALTRSVLV